MAELSERARSVRRRIMTEIMSRGTAPTMAELLAEFAMSKAEMARLMRDLEGAICVALQDEEHAGAPTFQDEVLIEPQPPLGELVYARPFAAFRNHYAVTVAGQQNWYAECAVEACAISGQFPGSEVIVDSVCRQTKAPVRLVGRDGFLVDYTPRTLRVHLAYPVREMPHRVAGWCDYNSFFVSEDAVTQWRAAHPEIGGDHTFTGANGLPDNRFDRAGKAPLRLSAHAASADIGATDADDGAYPYHPARAPCAGPILASYAKDAFGLATQWDGQLHSSAIPVSNQSKEVPMSRARVYAMVQQEKRDLAALLRELTPQEWESPSLCAGWRVRDVVAHVLYDGTPLLRYGSEVIRVRGSADRLNRLYLDRARGWSTEELLAAFEATIARSYSARIQPKLVLADLLIHQQDIRRPLNRLRTVPEGTLRMVLDNPDPFINPKRRLKGLRWTATDIQWTDGTGPEVHGPGEAIVMAVGGRPAALAQLDGPGVEILRTRLDGD